MRVVDGVLVLGVPVVQAGPVVVRPLRRMNRVLLGLLALRASQPVPVDWIVACLWPESCPPSARANLRSHVATLRRALPAGVRIAAVGRGYQLEAAPELVDVTLFRRLVAKAREEAGDLPATVARLTRAVDLWRGPFLHGEQLPEPLAADVAALGELRLAAIEDLMEARLALGQHRQVTPALSALVVEHAYRERFWGQLMRALHGGGRTGEALQVYRRLHDVLRAELSVGPSPETVRIRDRILHRAV